LRDRPRRYLLVSVGTIFRTDKFVVQDHGLVRQPAVRGPEGIGKRVEGAASLPELVELGVNPIEGAVLVMGAALELLSPTTRNP
jgi:hypothetical protein